jgi:hypothetical protein
MIAAGCVILLYAFENKEEKDPTSQRPWRGRISRLQQMKDAIDDGETSCMYRVSRGPVANQQGNLLGELEKALMVESRKNKEQVTENAPGGNSTPAASPTNPTKFHPK